MFNSIIFFFFGGGEDKEKKHAFINETITEKVTERQLQPNIYCGSHQNRVQKAFDASSLNPQHNKVVSKPRQTNVSTEKISGKLKGR